MSEAKVALSIRYVLNLEESQDGFKHITLGKKQVTQFITPLISIGLIIWGFYLGVTGLGCDYVILGAIFLLVQSAVRYLLLPQIFKRQFVKYQLGKNEQTLSLSQNTFQVMSQTHERMYAYSEVKRFVEGRLTYVIELKTRVVIIVPKRALTEPQQKTLLENTFKRV
ncbi:YcxB family protein [Acinetobacter rathckeae]|uniref:YcxB family protein n=1 Tax=Acinetobacter rathckeae TaxID=2605272 RepID=UPI0018A2725A|nr:YcxB family protein [Acinetobacter rathckeae]MBF7688512.1 YcxB family protein [Acinetobacter rathckeae]